MEDDRLLEAKTVNVQISLLLHRYGYGKKSRRFIAFWEEFFCHANYCGNSVCNDIYIIVLYSKLIACYKKLKKKWWNVCGYTAVRRVDEVVRHQHLVTQDQLTQVSNKFSDIPAEDFTINIELFLQTFTNVELVRQNWIVSKATSPGREPRFSYLFSNALPLRRTLFLI